MDAFDELGTFLAEMKAERPSPRKPMINTFGDVATILNPFIPKRGMPPILQTVNFCGNKVQGTDLETFIVLEIEGLNVKACFEASFLKALSGVPLSASINKTKHELEIGNGNKQSIPLFPKEEFPPFPTFREIVNQITLPVQVWDILVRTGKASNFRDREDAIQRITLSGVLLRSIDDQLNVIAADGFVLTVNSLGVSNTNFNERDTIIPASLLNKVDKVVRKLKAESVILTFYDGHFKVEAGGDGAKVTVVSELIKNIYPDYAQILPNLQDQKLTIIVNKFELEKALKEVANNERSRGEKYSLTRFTFLENEILLEVLGEGKVKGTWKLDANVAGEGFVIYFSAKRFLQVLSAMTDSEFVIVSLRDDGSPGLITNKNSQAVIMPMRVGG